MAFGVSDGQGQAGQGQAGQRSGHGFSRRRCLVLGLAVIIAACRPIFTNHGYIPTEADLAVLQIGIDTRESVAATIGKPTVSELLGDDAWYYVQSRWKTVGAAASVEIDREVVAITFDVGGTVANIERFGLEKGRIVPLSRRVTTTNIRGKGVLAQIFGNIGKLNTDNLFK